MDRTYISYGGCDLLQVEGYDRLIVEPTFYTADQVLAAKANGNKILGYVSFSEVGRWSPMYDSLSGYALAQNSNWESVILDIENIRVQEILLSYVEKLMSIGYDGVLLDNMDNVGPWGVIAHMSDAMVEMIRQFRTKCPKAIIIQNRGVKILDETYEWVDEVLFESVYSQYDFETRSYGLRGLSDLQWQLADVEKVRARDVSVFHLEYTNAHATRERLEELLGVNRNFYIGNINLQGAPKFY